MSSQTGGDIESRVPFDLAVLKTILNFILGPIPRGLPGEGPDCQFPQEIMGFGPIPARIRGVRCFLFCFWH